MINRVPRIVPRTSASPAPELQVPDPWSPARRRTTTNVQDTRNDQFGHQPHQPQQQGADARPRPPQIGAPSARPGRPREPRRRRESARGTRPPWPARRWPRTAGNCGSGSPSPAPMRPQHGPEAQAQQHPARRVIASQPSRQRAAARAARAAAARRRIGPADAGQPDQAPEDRRQRGQPGDRHQAHGGTAKQQRARSPERTARSRRRRTPRRPSSSASRRTR